PSHSALRRGLVPAELVLIRHRRTGAVSFGVAVSRAIELAVVARLLRHHVRGASVVETPITALWDEGAITAGRALRLARPPWHPLPTEDGQSASVSGLVIDSLARADGPDDGVAVLIVIEA